MLMPLFMQICGKNLDDGRIRPKLLRIKGRHQRDFVVGPAHEEVVTALIA